MKRPSIILLSVLLLSVSINTVLFFSHKLLNKEEKKRDFLYNILTPAMGLSDLAIATEARYTRHPAVSDLIVPFMDHPGAIEHFPTGSFWIPQAPAN
jgi:hypothetical protein